MSQNKVHFEVFARRGVTASWSLELATEARTQAMELAEALIAEKRAASVRVVKETLDSETGEYRSLTVLTKGEQGSVVRRAPSEDVDTQLCVEPGDLYTVHAREMIGRLLDGWLRRKRSTPFELLHSASLLEELDASGMDLQHAIQKISIPEAQARGVSTHEVIRKFQALADRTLERVMRDQRRRAFPDIKAQGFAIAAQRLSAEPDGAYLLGGAIAGWLQSGTTWGEKLDRLLDLAETAPRAGCAFAFAVLAQPLSEILGWAGGLADLAGPDQDLGASLAVLTRLVASEEVALLTRVDPGLEQHFPPLSPRITRLAERLKDENFAEVRAALARRILMELLGSRRLRPGDPAGEIQILRALASVLTVFAGRILSPDDVQAAFAERSKSMVSSNFVQAYLESANGPLAEARALVRLAENVVGTANKRAVAKWIAATVEALRFESELRSTGQSVGVRLSALAELQQALVRVGFDEADQTQICGKIGEIGGLIETDSKLTANVAKAAAPVTHRVMMLLQLASGETAPLGPVTSRARAEVQKLVRTPEVRAELAGSPALIDQIRSLMSAA